MILYGIALVVLNLVPRLCTEALKAHGVPPLVPVGAIAIVMTARAVRGLLRDNNNSFSDVATHVKKLPWKLVLPLVLCDGLGDVMQVLGSAFPALHLRDVQVIGRLQVMMSLLVTAVAYSLYRLPEWRLQQKEVAGAVLNTLGVLVYFLSAGLRGGMPWDAVGMLVAARVAAELAGLGERAALARGAPKELVLLLTNGFVPILFFCVVWWLPAVERATVFAVLSTFLVEAVIFAMVCMLLGPLAGGIQLVITVCDMGNPAAALLVANVAGAVAFLEVRIRARQRGMSSVQINLWMMLAFALTVLYAPWDLNAGMGTGLALMIGSAFAV